MLNSNERRTPIHAAVMECIEQLSKSNVPVGEIKDLARSNTECSPESLVVVEMAVLHLAEVFGKTTVSLHSPYSSLA